MGRFFPLMEKAIKSWSNDRIPGSNNYKEISTKPAIDLKLWTFTCNLKI